MVTHFSVDEPNPTALAAASTTTAKKPSTNSGDRGRASAELMSPITKGATATIPSTSDVNQPRQTIGKGVEDGPSALIARVARVAAIAVATHAADNNPRT